MSWFSDIVDTVEDAADVASDIGTGNWQDVAATVIHGVADVTGIEDLHTVATVVDNASWGNAIQFATDQVADALPDEMAGIVRTAGNVAGAAYDGNWAGAFNAGVQAIGDELPPQLVQLGG